MIDFLLRPLRRNFGRDKEYYRQIDDMFGFIPNNIELYKLALIHKSASFVLPDGSQMNNERLEYLGDAIIEAVTSDYLYIEFPDKTEGFLTQLRSKIVSRHSLNLLAERIGLDRLLVAHAGATLAQKHIYGDAFEAMMGAIYLDQGYEFVNRLLINNIYANYLDMNSLSEEETDFKSRLIEWCQKNHHSIRFVTKHTTPNTFLSTVFIDDMEMAHGRGTSKKESEQSAAHAMALSVSDAACLRMLDKLDKIDQQDSEVLAPSKPKKEVKTKTEKAEKPKAEKAEKPENTEKSKAPKAEKVQKVEKVENTEKVEKVEEPVLAPEAVTEPGSEASEQKPKPRSKRAPRRAKSEPAAPATDAPAAESDAVQEPVEQSAEQPAEPSKRRPRARKPAKRAEKPASEPKGEEPKVEPASEDKQPASVEEPKAE